MSKFKTYSFKSQVHLTEYAHDGFSMPHIEEMKLVFSALQCERIYNAHKRLPEGVAGVIMDGSCEPTLYPYDEDGNGVIAENYADFTDAYHTCVIEVRKLGGVNVHYESKNDASCSASFDPFPVKKLATPVQPHCAHCDSTVLKFAFDGEWDMDEQTIMLKRDDDSHDPLIDPDGLCIKCKCGQCGGVTVPLYKTVQPEK